MDPDNEATNKHTHTFVIIQNEEKNLLNTLQVFHSYTFQFKFSRDESQCSEKYGSKMNERKKDV